MRSEAPPNAMSHSLPHPDPLPLREALRGLRHGLRRSRRALREGVPLEALPGPAALLAGPVLESLDTLAGGLDAAGTDLARRLLGGDAHHVPPFDVLAADPHREELLAEAAYAALRGALLRMGDGEAFVSEAAARRAVQAVGGTGAGAEPSRLAADLALRLIDAQVIRDLAPVPSLRVEASRAPAVAVVAALLWLMADRRDAGPGLDSDAALDAATDLAVALAGEIAPAVAGRDIGALAALLDQFAPHV